MARTARWKGELESPEEQFMNKRRLVVCEAGRAFNEKGFHNTSIDDIASALGIAKSIVYHYFKNKVEILLECIACGFEIADNALAMARQADTDGLGRVEIFVRYYVEGVASQNGACGTTLELHSIPDQEFPRIRTRQKKVDKQLRELVTEGIADGSIEEMDPMLAIDYIMGAANTLPRWYRPGGRLSASDIATQYAVFARRMLERKKTPDASQA